MPSLVDYKRLDVVDSPTGDGGIAINDNFKALADRFAHIATTNPTASDDTDDGFAVGSRWVNTSTSIEWLCTSNAAGAATWIKVAPVRSVAGQEGAVTLTTGDVTESTNLYYTTARVTSDAPNVTIGTANGLSMASGQVLSMAAATVSTPGAMPSSDKTKLDGATSAATAGQLVLRDGSGGIAVTGITNNISTQKIVVSKSGTTVGTRKQVNLIEGTNSTITVADNAGSDRVDVTIGAAAYPRPNNRRVGFVMPTGNGFSYMGDDATTAGTITHQAATSDAPATVRIATAASINAVSSLVGRDIYKVGRNLLVQAYVRLNATDNRRSWLCLSNQTAPTMAASSNPAGHYFGFRYDTGVGTNWYSVTKDGTTINAVDTGVAGSTTGVKFEIVCDDTGGSYVFKINGTTVSTHTTNLPASGTILGYNYTVTALNNATSRTGELGWIYVESDL